MRHFARTALLATLVSAVAGPALAQTVPPGQTCGGLLCDIGMFGHKVPVNADGTPAPPEKVAAAVAEAEAYDPHRLPCHDFLCRAFGQKEADAAPPPPVAAAAPEPVRETKVVRKKKKRVAKADAAPKAAQ